MSSTPTFNKMNSDKILCSAGQGEMTKEACLGCALALQNRCGFDYSVLKAMFQDKERTGIHVTDLTGCLRQAYYAKVEAPLEYPHEMLTRFLGTGIHHYVESFLVEPEILKTEVPVNAYGLVGSVDLYYIYHNGRVVDLKTTRWLKLDKLPYGSHVKQVNIYAALLRAQGEPVNSAAIQYIDMSGPSKCSKCRGPVAPDEGGVMICTRCGHSLPTWHPGVATVEVALENDAMVAEWIATRLKILELSIEQSQAPEAEPSYICDYCAFRTRCEKEIGDE